jgi:hypothetical protein
MQSTIQINQATAWVGLQLKCKMQKYATIRVRNVDMQIDCLHDTHWAGFEPDNTGTFLNHEQ